MIQLSPVPIVEYAGEREIIRVRKAAGKVRALRAT